MYNFGSYSGFLFSRMNGNLCTFDIYDLGNLSQKKTVKKETYCLQGGRGVNPISLIKPKNGHQVVTFWSPGGLLVVY